MSGRANLYAAFVTELPEVDAEYFAIHVTGVSDISLIPLTDCAQPLNT